MPQRSRHARPALLPADRVHQLLEPQRLEVARLHALLEGDERLRKRPPQHPRVAVGIVVGELTDQFTPGLKVAPAPGGDPTAAGATAAMAPEERRERRQECGAPVTKGKSSCATMP